MTTARSDSPFIEELPRLLRERGVSLRALAAQVEISDSHLSRVLRKANYKTASPDLTRRVAVALGLPEDYFPDFREAFVIEQVRKNAQLREELYNKLRKQP